MLYSREERGLPAIHFCVEKSSGTNPNWTLSHQILADIPFANQEAKVAQGAARRECGTFEKAALIEVLESFGL